MRQQFCPVSDPSHIGSVRRSAAVVAADAGLGQTEAGRVAIVATELATNLYRHGTGGVMLLQGIRGTDATGVELIAVDSGPGMAHPAQCMTDGYSTSGTPGSGLGAVRRLATEFDLHSSLGTGTVVLARVMTRPPDRDAPSEWGVVCSAAPGESVSGDAWRICEDDGGIAVMIADGLGHGVLAAEAAVRATGSMAGAPFGPVVEIMGDAHVAMHGTRGGAVAVAQRVAHTPTLAFCGVGNIAAALVPPEGRLRGLASFNGTLGVEARAIREMPYEWGIGELLVMHSDGVQSRWTTHREPGLLSRHPAVIAAVLHRDFLRGRDDATVVVVRRRR